MQAGQTGKLAELPSLVNVLQLMEHLAGVVIQDALELIEDYPEHMIYQGSPFDGPKFQELYSSYHANGGLKQVG